MTFQTKLFSAATAAAIIALAVAGALFASTTLRRTDERIEQTLVAETRLAADLLSRARWLRRPARPRTTRSRSSIRRPTASASCSTRA